MAAALFVVVVAAVSAAVVAVSAVVAAALASPRAAFFARAADVAANVAIDVAVAVAAVAVAVADDKFNKFDFAVAAVAVAAAVADAAAFAAFAADFAAAFAALAAAFASPRTAFFARAAFAADAFAAAALAADAFAADAFAVSPSLPQNQEHENILVHPDASTVTPKRNRKQRSRKNNGRTSSGVGSDDKFNQGAGESVDGRTIGKLFVSNREIAKGSNGTIVLEGTHEIRPVAVKRLVKAHHVVAYKEYQNLCVSDRHSNIVRLYGVEENQDFVYLALERCTCSLNDLIQMQLLDAPTTSGDQATEVNIEYKVRLQSMKGTLPEVKLWEDNGYPSPTLWKLMRDMVSGLVHLHKLGMIHRDLKPQNVLILLKEESLCAKLSDMGISKCLVEDKSSLGDHATGCGSSGWQAPEQLLNQSQTRAVDMFSLGCVLFYCVTNGEHPFGDRFERDNNIVRGKADLFLVEHIPEAVDLLSRLLDTDAKLRLKASEVLNHPLFWDSNTRLWFLHEVSERLKLEERKADSDIVKALESVSSLAFGTKWNKKMQSAFLKHIGKYRRYKYDSVRDLLRVVRNQLNHYLELPLEIQKILGPVNEGFDGYFRSRYPKLLMEVYKVMHHYCREEEGFNKYFKGSVL